MAAKSIPTSVTREQSRGTRNIVSTIGQYAVNVLLACVFIFPLVFHADGLTQEQRADLRRPALAARVSAGRRAVACQLQRGVYQESLPPLSVQFDLCRCPHHRPGPAGQQHGGLRTLAPAVEGPETRSGDHHRHLDYPRRSRDHPAAATGEHAAQRGDRERHSASHRAGSTATTC